MLLSSVPFSWEKDIYDKNMFLYMFICVDYKSCIGCHKASCGFEDCTKIKLFSDHQDSELVHTSWWVWRKSSHLLHPQNSSQAAGACWGRTGSGEAFIHFCCKLDSLCHHTFVGVIMMFIYFIYLFIFIYSFICVCVCMCFLRSTSVYVNPI